MSAVGEAAQNSELPFQLASDLRRGPLELPSQLAAGVASSESKRDALRRMGLVKDEPMHGDETTNNRELLLPPNTVPDIRASQNMKHIGLAANEARKESDPVLGVEPGEKPGAMNDVPHTGILTQLRKPNKTGRRKVYRSFHMSDILSLDD